ncbi:MAG: ATP-binding protein [Phycisphaerae bacterium]|nr:ATP-binding protein [Phycisphaerae bacterium]
MAKHLRLSLAMKLRLLFGAAVLGIIAAALVVPWYFLEVLAEQSMQQQGAQISGLVIDEHLRDPKDPAIGNLVASLYAAGGVEDGRSGPFFIKLSPQMKPDRPLDSIARAAARTFRRTPHQGVTVTKTEDERGRPVHRSFRAVRADPICMKCHAPAAGAEHQFQPGQLVGMIDVAVPADVESGALVWWTRGAFVVGAALATLLAIILFAILTQKLILRPLRQLRNVADKVTEGDLTVRSTIRTGDELQRLGDSFNEMLTAIADQHEQLRAANRALDLKLDELAQANVSLFEANKVKTEFLANVSHELRTPLNSIIGFADLLGESPEERTRHYGRNIGASAKNLLSLINDILDLARLEAGKATIRWDKVSLIDTCQTLVALMKPLADKKELVFEAHLGEDLPIVTTDASKCQQILYNLLSNAIKFTPAGGSVIVSAAVGTSGEGQTQTPEVTIAVTDTGPGIADADQQSIFEKFYQSDRSLTKEAAGAGLGLSIAKELAGLLGGRLTLKSSPGQGAVFTLHLPIEPPASLTAPATPPASPPPPAEEQ